MYAEVGCRAALLSCCSRALTAASPATRRPSGSTSRGSGAEEGEAPGRGEWTTLQMRAVSARVGRQKQELHG